MTCLNNLSMKDKVQGRCKGGAYFMRASERDSRAERGASCTSHSGERQPRSARATSARNRCACQARCVSAACSPPCGPCNVQA